VKKLKYNNVITNEALLAVIEDSQKIKSFIYAQKAKKTWTVEDIQEAIKLTLKIDLPISEANENLYARIKGVFDSQVVSGTEEKLFSVDSGPDVLEQVLIRENESGLYFSVDPSFVMQDVDVIHSPYGNGPIILSESI
jgi:hypothetical protein